MIHLCNIDKLCLSFLFIDKYDFNISSGKYG